MKHKLYDFQLNLKSKYRKGESHYNLGQDPYHDSISIILKQKLKTNGARVTIMSEIGCFHCSVLAEDLGYAIVVYNHQA